MSFRTAALLSASFALLPAGRSFAQPGAAPTTAPTQLAPARAPAAAPAASAPAASAGLEEPRLPEINDPMLEPPERAPSLLQTWQQAVQLVRRQSTTLRLAAAETELTQAQSRQTLARALPSLTGTGSLNHHLIRGEGSFFSPTRGLLTGSIPNPATTWQAGLGLQVPVVAAQAWYDTATASRSVRAAKLNAKEAERQALGAVADAIVTVVTAERLAEVSRVSLRSALSTLDLNQRRARLGAATSVDVLRAEQEAVLARAQVIAADEDLRQSRERLGLALGTHEPWGVTPEIRLDALAADARASCQPQNTVDNRSDVRAAAANVEVAERNVTSVNLTYLPSVDLVSDLTYLSHEIRSPNGRHVTWTIGGVLSWPLYDGGLRYGQKEANRAQVRIRREQLVDAKRTARLEVTQTLRSVRVAEANLAVSQRSREVARETARLSRVAFVNGSGTSFELVDTTRRLREAELDLAVKEFNVIRARIAAVLASSNCSV